MLGLQIPFRFFVALILGSALFPMAQTARDAALLGGAFLVGLGAIEVVLRFGGLWATCFALIAPFLWILSRGRDFQKRIIASTWLSPHRSRDFWRRFRSRSLQHSHADWFHYESRISRALSDVVHPYSLDMSMAISSVSPYSSLSLAADFFTRMRNCWGNKNQLTVKGAGLMKSLIQWGSLICFNPYWIGWSTLRCCVVSIISVSADNYECIISIKWNLLISIHINLPSICRSK